MSSIAWASPFNILLGLLLIALLLLAAQLWAQDLSASRATLGDRLRRLAGQPFTVEQRIARHGTAARARLAPFFTRAGIAYPPAQLTLVGLKQEKRLELYAPATNGTLQFVHSYAILAASGGLGPKLRQGDLQVPEGIYGIELLNPNSRFHLSLRINYPSSFDRQQAALEQRSNLGGDIMIHGSNVSVGCLAIGDSAIEELFVLANDVGLKNITVLLSPLDFRQAQLESSQLALLPAWMPEVYKDLERRLKQLGRKP